MKRFFALCLAAVYLSSNLTFSTYASERSDLDQLDVIISGHTFLKTDNSEENLWPDTLSDVEIIPLYSPAGKTIAYYLSLPDSYAVINNNINNPTAIEFGEGENELIQKILDNDINAHIIYNSPYDVYNLNENTLATINNEEQKTLYEHYPDLEENNSTLAKIHTNIRSAIEEDSSNMITPYNYGFIDLGNMPTTTCTSDKIRGTNIDWVVTTDFSNIASNHCGATAITNLALYYANQGYSDLKKSTPYNTFVAVHNVCPDGPRPTIAGYADMYFEDCGYTLRTSSVGNFSDLVDATTDDHPCAMLLANGAVDWHWILGIGWREYITGDQYIRIMDNWEETTNRFYKPGDGSIWVSAKEYWVVD